QERHLLGTRGDALPVAGDGFVEPRRVGEEGVVAGLEGAVDGLVRLGDLLVRILNLLDLLLHLLALGLVLLALAARGATAGRRRRAAAARHISADLFEGRARAVAGSEFEVVLRLLREAELGLVARRRAG